MKDSGISFSTSLCTPAVFTADRNITILSVSTCDPTCYPMCDPMCVSMCVCVYSHSVGCNWVKLTWQSTPIHTGDTHHSCRGTYLHLHQICAFVLPQTEAVLFFFHKPSHSSVIVTRVSWLSFVFYNVLDVQYRMHQQLRGSPSIQVSLGVEVESALLGTKARDEWRR